MDTHPKSIPEVEVNPLTQFFLFILVGVSGTIITLSLVYILTELLLFYYVLSVIIGFSVGICNNYFWNRKYTFQSDNPKIVLEYSNFVLIYIIGMFVYSITTIILTEFFDIWYFYSSILSVGTSAINNFLLSKFWVFQRKRSIVS